MAQERIYKAKRARTGAPIVIHSKAKTDLIQVPPTSIEYYSIASAMGESLECFFKAKKVDGLWAIEFAQRVPVDKEPSW